MKALLPAKLIARRCEMPSGVEGAEVRVVCAAWAL